MQVKQKKMELTNLTDLITSIDPITVLTIVGIIATAIGTGIGMFRAYHWNQDRKPDFHYERYPVDQQWFIRIQFVTKLIRKFSITLDNKPLSLSRLQDTFECSFQINGGDNFSVPVGSWKEDSKIVMKFDKHKKKMKFKDIPIATR